MNKNIDLGKSFNKFKKIIVMSNYDLWQMERFGDILPEPIVLPSGEIEGSNEEINRSAEWVELQAELQLNDYEK